MQPMPRKWTRKCLHQELEMYCRHEFKKCEIKCNNYLDISITVYIFIEKLVIVRVYRYDNS